ncbi:MAG: ABC transporter ATP-binding protein/permease [Deltaproteobacteria bacterium]|jgi:ABC-type multidrug transport system fused ATPase/permease subunit|nr:ABC transporter ATP-binding protein/permease [Deltaproteobacteria bacterium]
MGEETKKDWAKRAKAVLAADGTGARATADDGSKASGKGSDLKLVSSLWPSTKGFRHILALGFLMIVFASLIGIVLPYLTKVALDDYILPLGRVLRMPGGAPPADLGDLLGKLEDSGSPGIWFLPAGEADSLDARKERELVDKGLLDPMRWYVRPREALGLSEDELARLAKDSGGRIVPYPRYVAIRERDLAALPKAAALALRGADIQGLKILALVFALAMLLGYFFDLGQRVFLEISSQRLGHNLRARVLRHLFGLSQGFFDRLEAGRLTTRLTSDINNINNLVKSTASTFFSDLLGIAGVIVIMFSLNWKLALLTLALSPIVILSTRVFGRIARVQQRDLRAKVALINQRFSETHAGMGIIKAFNREDGSVSEFGVLNDANYRMGMRQLHAFAVFMPVVDFVSSIALATVLWFGGQMVMGDSASLGVLAAFAVYCNRFFTPIKDLAEKMNIFQSAFASIERLLGLLEVDDRTLPEGDPVRPKSPGRGFELRDVSFRYRPDLPWAVRDLSLGLNPGETLALVGETGCGKTTVINLLLRFYDPEKGSILFDGIPLKTLDIGLHRKRIGLVTQDVYLYGGSVMDNLRLGRKDVSDRMVREAAEAVGASRFIERLPKGYDETLGSEGRTLSAGERQLLACARALIGAPEFVILDEATAFVDSESELLISAAMSALFEGRSSIVVAHRLSTIRKADRIIVLEKGTVQEEGTHEALIAQKGLYYHLAMLQGLAESLAPSP